MSRRGFRPPSRPSAPRRGNAGRARYQQQLDLALLELERSRRENECRVASARMLEIEARLREVEALIRAHQERLGLRPEAEVPARAESAQRTGGKSKVLRY